MLRKILLSFFAFLIISVGSMSLFSRSAQAAWYNQSYAEWSSVVFDTSNPEELFGERYAAANTRWVVYGLAALLLEHPYIDCIIQLVSGSPVILTFAQCAVFIPNLFSSNTNPGVDPPSGLLAIFGQNKSLSVTTYFRDIANRWHIVPEAQAQFGFGFDTGGTMVLKLWKASRDATYGLLIIVMVVMAFMIMFRVKISPQTVITVQSALPKVIMTLILITFSFAIAGLMIDLMYVFIGLLSAILIQSDIITSTWSELFVSLTSGNGSMAIMWSYYLYFVGMSASAIFSFLGGGFFANVSFFIGLIIVIVLAVVILILSFRVWWMLIKNFVLLILTIAFAPFPILFGAFGGGGFGKWLKGLAALLAIYPMVGFMLLLAFSFLQSAAATMSLGPFGSFIIDPARMPFPGISPLTNSPNTWVPPLMGGSAVDASFIWLGVSLAIVALTPKAGEMIKGIVSGRPIAYGTAIGEGLAFAGGAATGAFAQARGGIEQEAYGLLGRWGIKKQQDNATGLGGWAARKAVNAAQGKRAIVLDEPRIGGTTTKHRKPGEITT